MRLMFRCMVSLQPVELPPVSPNKSRTWVIYTSNRSRETLNIHALVKVIGLVKSLVSNLCSGQTAPKCFRSGAY